MKDWTLIRDRYLRDEFSVRMGGLAANLSRINSFVAHDANREVVESIIDESKFFIEWIAAQAEINTAGELVELQIQLARWHWNWPRIWADPVLRNEVALQSKSWSKRILELSGLLTK
jgi:hypothetical protein